MWHVFFALLWPYTHTHTHTYTRNPADQEFVFTDEQTSSGNMNGPERETFTQKRYTHAHTHIHHSLKIISIHTHVIMNETRTCSPAAPHTHPHTRRTHCMKNVAFRIQHVTSIHTHVYRIYDFFFLRMAMRDGVKFQIVCVTRRHRRSRTVWSEILSIVRKRRIIFVPYRLACSRRTA